jgi:hypothetical protein
MIGIVAGVGGDGFQHFDDQPFGRDPGRVEIPCDLFGVAGIAQVQGRRR